MTIPRGIIPGKSSSNLGELTVDNLFLDGNTISTTDTNGDMNITLDGTGVVNISSGSSGAIINLDSVTGTGNIVYWKDNTSKEFYFEHFNNYLRFGVQGGNEALRMQTTGEVTLTSGNSKDITLTPAGNVNISANSLEMAGTEVIDSSRNVSVNQLSLDSGMTINGNELSCTAGLRVVRPGGNPDIGINSPTGNDSIIYFQESSTSRAWLGYDATNNHLELRNHTTGDEFRALDTGGWTFNDGSSDVASVSATGKGSFTGGVVTQSGATVSRPGSPSTGQTYFDTDLGKMIVYNGSAWVNMDGTSL